MRIFFQGLGGAGQRHLRIFKSILPNAEFLAVRSLRKTPLLNPDFSPDLSESLENKYNVRCFDYIDDVWKEEPNFVVISLPTSMHADASVTAISNGVDVFVEKPGIANTADYQAVASALEKYGASYFVSFQRRFHPLAKIIKDVLRSESLGKVVAVQLNVGSFVPDWHPYEKFSELYACRADLGGGVVRTECHELEMLFSIFGDPATMYLSKGARTGLVVGVEDTAEILLDYKSFGIQASLCFMQKRTERLMTIRASQGQLVCDFQAGRYLLSRDGHPDKGWVDCSMSMDAMFHQQAQYYLDGQFEKDASLKSMRALSQLFDMV